ncbi:MAG: peptidase M14 [Gemmatimonadetes bacterium]|uniref:Peptidase M14 n=1 Tax=Candidatus Kutchimonas denitrificans TaxID=3056748 RepID=A0AAE5C8N5_9BACT|nr:peptidase M14 [Gemmatimonadota bacterium]NIR74641.1 peptidase M14 [Candidatus Kutchimonas denitrificans]NIS02831.1 peptidase M14 [Gemmatimonadota bacterium]NIT68992.1 peptidase M14 [Gemmatimonadota bacterium]NIU52297.1 peptidase M14 [Gemmatimonadota bacterium]
MRPREDYRTVKTMETIRTARGLAILTVCAISLVGMPELHAQSAGPQLEHELPLTWDHWLDHEAIGERAKLMADTWPEFLTLQSLGNSYGGREMWMMTINNPRTGDEMDKAAMFIEANVHGNEIQGGEVCLYTIWYLMENYGRIDEITRLVDERVFYILPSVNPDGRDYFMHGTGSGARTGHVPVDSDGDGLLDEDGADDLNGNGVIEQIRKYAPGEGTHRISHDDRRIMEAVPEGEVGDWVLLGFEGIDNDGDGRVNEDPVGGYDPNRNYGSDWQPNYIQGGSMDYPFQLPEARAINDFWMAHPNIAGVQSYHNSGGMILRGPGAAWQGTYPQEDIRVYDELAENGERILPYYNYLIIWQGLYTVHGGSIDWTNDGLGIISFSNELWSGGQYFGSPLLQEQQEDSDSPISGQKSRFFFDDLVEFGDNYVEWAPFDHPEYGEVEMGGWKKYFGRVNPRFMSMELFHRNMAFTLYHADQMPLMTMGDATVEGLGDGLYRVRIDIRNERLIPTITVRAMQNRVVRPDLLSVDGDVEIVAAGWVRDKHRPGPTEMIDQEELDRIIIRSGHPGRTTRTIEYLVRGSGSMTVTYSAVKGGTVSTTVRLR